MNTKIIQIKLTFICYGTNKWSGWAGVGIRAFLSCTFTIVSYTPIAF